MRFRRLGNELQRLTENWHPSSARHGLLRGQERVAGKVLVLELSDLMVKISGLKAIRKAGDQQIKAFEYMIFKEIVKDRYGEKAYHEILEAVEQELQAYKASGLMRHEYTRSGAKSNVTSINKL